MAANLVQIRRTDCRFLMNFLPDSAFGPVDLTQTTICQKCPFPLSCATSTPKALSL